MARTAYEPTEAYRHNVGIMVAAQMPIDKIAMAMGISQEQLKKHFKTELESGGAKAIATVLMARYQAALEGNVVAQNALLKQAGLAGPDDAYRPQPAPVVAQSTPQNAKSTKLGKKEVQQLEAENPDPDTMMGQLIARREGLSH